MGFAHRRLVAVVALLGVAGSAFFARDLFDVVQPYGFEDPESENVRAAEAFEGLAGVRATPEVVALVQPAAGETGGDGTAVASVANELRDVRGVGAVRIAERQTSSGGAVLLGFLAADVDDVADVGEAAITALGNQPRVELGGFAVASAQINDQTAEDLRRVELVAIPILLLLSLWIFRRPAAALLPLAIGAVAISTTMATIRLMSEVISIDVFSLNIVTGLGLGLAIDYSLLIVSRYREELGREFPPDQALRRTLSTAGRTVAFSGIVVAAALAALLVFPQRFLYSVGAGGAIVVLLSAAAALTVLPALLALLGSRVAVRESSPQAQPKGGQAGGKPSRGWRRVAGFVTRFPAPVASLAVVALVVAAVPLAGLELTRASASVLPADASARQVDETLRADFAAGEITPIVVVADVAPSPAAQRNLASVTDELAREPGIARVTSPAPIGDRALRLDVITTAEPFSNRAQRLVDRIRDADWPYPVMVGGTTAELVDQKASLVDHLPIAAAIILVTTLALIFAMTRSVVLPAVAVLMNLLTIGAAFGIVVAIFQEGRFEGLLDYTSQGAIDTSITVLLVTVAFGLSTDYGIFLLARIREARKDASTEREAIVTGLEHTGRIITAAALLFAVAIGAFILSELSYVKALAIGLAAAVIIDATIVRAMLVPTVLALLGRAAWWRPGLVKRVREAFGTR